MTLLGTEIPTHAQQSLETQNNLGPDSLLWHYAGDMRIGLTGLSAGVLQLMHPGVGAGVAEHSKFFDEPWERIERSLPWILGVIYDPDPNATGKQVRDFHKSVKGSDEKGRTYRALNPETYWWAHATFQDMVEQVVNRFSHRTLSSNDKELLYEQGVEWYSRYSVSKRPVPKNYQEFQEKVHYIQDEVLEMTPSAEKAINKATSRDVEKVPQIPGIIWKFLGLPVSETVRLVTIGGLPENVRKRFDIPWSPVFDEPRLKVLEETIKRGWHFLPAELRYHPRARAGNRFATRKAAQSLLQTI